MKRQFKKVKPEYLRCRTWGHTWEFCQPREHKVEYLLGIRETMECSVCSTYREFVFSPSTGELMHRGYQYPIGYSLGRDIDLPEGTTLREAFRAEWAARDRAGEIRRNHQALVRARENKRPRRKAS